MASSANHHRRADPRYWRRGLPLAVLGLHADADAATGGTRRPLRSVRHDAAGGDGGGLLLPRIILTHLPIELPVGWLVGAVRVRAAALVCSAQLSLATVPAAFVLAASTTLHTVKL